jgi:ribonuclease P/MRP protein subunit RPP40
MLVEMVNQIAEGMERGCEMDWCQFDLAKAFDVVPHSLLLQKMRAYGIHGDVVDWYNDFLTGRTQTVVLSGVESEELGVASGVPQGTVSGPCLFLIYINDLPENIASGNYLFADDNGLVREIEAETDREALQKDVQTVAEWCGTWGMRLNVNKTKMMTLTRKEGSDNRQYYINNEAIATVNEMKCLGVTITSTLNWARHVEEVYGKCTRLTNFIYRVLRDSSMEARQIAYQSMVLPVAEYASAVWDTGEGILSQKVDMIQRRAVRMIGKKFRRNECVTQMMNAKGWSSLQTRRKENRLCLYYRIYNGLTILNKAKYCRPATFRSRHDNTHKVFREGCTKQYTARTFFYATSVMWNALDSQTVQASNVKEFKKAIKSMRTSMACDHHAGEPLGYI